MINIYYTYLSLNYYPCTKYALIILADKLR